ncbi:MAG TPA: hypothetical protein VKT82_00165 [Ktedonobacterales bacterium]|nr:hypothetical protein [Ktedonobacterales bacterium]
MQQELSNRLIVAFPHLYRSWQGRDMDHVWRTRQDFECGNGWFALLWQLSGQLENLIGAFPDHEQEAYAPTIIKEKFGALRFSMTRRTPAMNRAICWAEGQSTHICEVCGKAGTLQKHEQLILARCLDHTPAQSEPWQPWPLEFSPTQDGHSTT